MSWPQIVMALWLCWNAILGVRDFVTDRSRTSGWATFGVFVVLALQGAIALVLHVGGFW